MNWQEKQVKLKKCDHCLVGKPKRVSFQIHPPSRKLNFLELVYFDLCGPFKVMSYGGALYYPDANLGPSNNMVNEEFEGTLPKLS